MTTVWNTKYALTAGIQQDDVELKQDSEGTQYHWDGWQRYVLGHEIFLTEAEAKRDGEIRRAKKIASLKKQIAKLEKLSF